jgi:hypothetical protein
MPAIPGSSAEQCHMGLQLAQGSNDVPILATRRCSPAPVKPAQPLQEQTNTHLDAEAYVPSAAAAAGAGSQGLQPVPPAALVRPGCS